LEPDRTVTIAFPVRDVNRAARTLTFLETTALRYVVAEAVATSLLTLNTAPPPTISPRLDILLSSLALASRTSLLVPLLSDLQALLLVLIASRREVSVPWLGNDDYSKSSRRVSENDKLILVLTNQGLGVVYMTGVVVSCPKVTLGVTRNLNRLLSDVTKSYSHVSDWVRGRSPRLLGLLEVGSDGYVGEERRVLNIQEAPTHTGSHRVDSSLDVTVRLNPWISA
jgi:hypothetical protein